MEQKRIVDVDATEALAEFSQGVELEYRIVEVKQHRRKKQDDGTLKWVDDIYYQVEKIVPSGWFGRKWQTVVFQDEYGTISEFENISDIKDWLLYRAGKRYEVVKRYKKRD